jgi:hypothetical protein
LTVVAPLLVAVVAARTPNLAAEPSGTGAWLAVASWLAEITATARPMINPQTLGVLFVFTDVVVIMFSSLLMRETLPHCAQTR